MKNLILIACLSLPFLGMTAVKTSITNGDWFSAETWSPAGVPFIEDTVIINHDILVSDTVDVGIKTLIINEGKTLEGNTLFALHGNLFNYGTIDLYILGIGDGEMTINEGIMQGQKLATSNPIFENTNEILFDTLNTSNDEFQNAGMILNNMVVTSGGFINTGFISTSSITITEEFENNADIRTGAFHCAGELSGTDGKFCVTDCFINVGSIDGTLDICDESTSFCDLNMGDISGSVTFCEVSSCATASTDKMIQKELIQFYPNPVSNYLTVQLSNNIGSPYSITLTDIGGRVVYTQSDLNQQQFQLDLSNYPTGNYFVRLTTSQSIIQERVIVQH